MWVSDGCRGVFEMGETRQLNCGSSWNSRKYCSWGAAETRVGDRLMMCEPKLVPSTHTPSTLCVQASPNPEFENTPLNYAHWVIAHLYPLVRTLGVKHDESATARRLQRSRLVVAHGRKLPGVALERWMGLLAELLGANCTHRRAVGNLTMAVGEPSSASVAKNWQPFRCNESVSFSVALFSACRHAPWKAHRWAPFASTVALLLGRQRTPLPRVLPARSRLLVGLRGSDARRGGFTGVEWPCTATGSAPAAAAAAGLAVECITFRSNATLRSVHAALGACALTFCMAYQTHHLIAVVALWKALVPHLPPALWFPKPTHLPPALWFPKPTRWCGMWQGERLVL
jgi:hypothetical protein